MSLTQLSGLLKQGISVEADASEWLCCKAQPFDMKIYPSDNEKHRNYKMQCIEELKWCRDHESEIVMLAKELHKMVCNGLPFKKRKICPDYRLLEQECDKNQTGIMQRHLS